MDILLDTLAVKFRVWDEARIEAVVRQLGGTITMRLAPIRWVRVEIEHTRAADLFLAYLRHPDVEDVSFDALVKPHAVEPCYAATNDPLLDGQFALKRLNVFHAWKFTKGAGVTVAMVDSGLNHLSGGVPIPEFAGKTVTRWNGPDDNNVLISDNTALVHGCGTASVMCAVAGDGIGPAGVAPEASLLSMAYMPAANPGKASMTEVTASLLCCYTRFGVRVINASVGVSGWGAPESDPFPSVRDALTYLRDQGAIVCMSAGNDGWDNRTYPSGAYNYPAAYAPYVGGHFNVGCSSYEDPDLSVLYSQRGTNVQLVTPGHAVWSARNAPRTVTTSNIKAPNAGWQSPWQDGAVAATSSPSKTYTTQYRGFNGTSCASPLAAGVVALTWAANPALTAAQVHSIILSTADAGQHPTFLQDFPNAVVPNAGRAVLKAWSMRPENAGAVFPYVNFFGRNARLVISGGAATMHLSGAVSMEVDGFSTDPITNVKVYVVTPGVGEALVYDGLPRTSRGTLLPFAAARLAGGKRIKVVASTATTTAESEYTDIAGYAASSAPPKTTASPAGGTLLEGAPITLTAESDNPPVAIHYRWGTGAWQTYSGPIPAQKDAGALQFYGVDCFGNIEGGVDYAGG